MKPLLVVLLGGCVAAALLGVYVEDDRSCDPRHPLEGDLELVQVVPVHRSFVRDAETPEEGGGDRLLPAVAGGGQARDRGV